MVTDVKENFDSDTAIITGDNIQNELLVLKDPIYPSLFYLKWKTGPSPETFHGRFTDKKQAIAFAKAHVKQMRWTQAAKNKETAERIAKNKAERIEKKKAKEIGKDSKASNTVR